MSVLGRMLSAPTLEQGAEVCLRYYLGLYLGEVLAQAGWEREALPDPHDLKRVADFVWPIEAQLTTVVMASPGTTGDAQKTERGYDATWDLRVAVLADLGDRLDTRVASQFYAAAAGMAIAHNGIAALNADGTWKVNSDGEPVTVEGTSVRWIGEGYRQLGPPRDRRALLAGEARLLVKVEGARSLRPSQPLPLPDAPLPPDREPPEPDDPAPVNPSLTIEREPVEE